MGCVSGFDRVSFAFGYCFRVDLLCAITCGLRFLAGCRGMGSGFRWFRLSVGVLIWRGFGNCCPG